MPPICAPPPGWYTPHTTARVLGPLFPFLCPHEGNEGWTEGQPALGGSAPPYEGWGIPLEGQVGDWWGSTPGIGLPASWNAPNGKDYFVPGVLGGKLFGFGYF